MPRKGCGRGLISVEDCVNQARISSESYVQSTEEESLKTVKREGLRVKKRLLALKRGEELKYSRIERKTVI